MNRLAVLMLLFVINIASASNPVSCETLQSALNQFRTKYQITGMALFVSSPKLNQGSCNVFSGSLEKKTQQQISKNNLWQIGSITKSYFSTILLQIEAESEAGKIPVQFNLNQQLKTWLPQYSDWGSVTIWQLLNMTSGIYSYTDLPISSMVLKQPNRVWHLKELIQLAYHHQPNTYFSPGKGWHYSDTNYLIVGQLIQTLYQKIEGHEVLLKTILDQKILQLFHLTNTYYYPAGLPKPLQLRMVHGYNYYSGEDFSAYNLSISGPAGAMIATPRAVAQWIQALFNDKVLPDKQLNEMISLVSQETGKPIKLSETKITPGYGLGLAEQYSKEFGPIWLYEGVTSGYTAVYFYAPRDKTIISFTASVGSIKPNPIPFSSLAKQLLKIVLLPPPIAESIYSEKMGECT